MTALVGPAAAAAMVALVVVVVVVVVKEPFYRLQPSVLCAVVLRSNR